MVEEKWCDDGCLKVTNAEDFVKPRGASTETMPTVLPLPFQTCFFFLSRVATWFGPQLHTSSDHRFIVGVP